jgi:hypothetical protein
MIKSAFQSVNVFLNMKVVLWLFSVLALGGLVVTACSTSRKAYESASYTIVRADGDFEIRDYPELRLASTKEGKEDDSFMRLFRYIDGGNEQKEKIAMTTPVFMNNGDMSFVVPEKNQANTPKPLAAEVTLKSMPAQRVIAYRYNGRANDQTQKAGVEKLKAWAAKDGLKINGEPIYAYYDPPWTPGALRRNEVLLPIEK